MLDLKEFADTLDNLTVQHKRRFRIRRVIRDGLIAGALLSVAAIAVHEIWLRPTLNVCYQARPDGSVEQVDCR